MNEASLNALSAWLTQAGLAGTAETDIVSEFCGRCVAAGIPLGRAQLFCRRLIFEFFDRIGHKPTSGWPLLSRRRFGKVIL
jgi:hypothetical protein